MENYSEYAVELRRGNSDESQFEEQELVCETLEEAEKYANSNLHKLEDDHFFRILEIVYENSEEIAVDIVEDIPDAEDSFSASIKEMLVLTKKQTKSLNPDKLWQLLIKIIKIYFPEEYETLEQCETANPSSAHYTYYKSNIPVHHDWEQLDELFKKHKATSITHRALTPLTAGSNESAVIMTPQIWVKRTNDEVGEFYDSFYHLGFLRMLNGSAENYMKMGKLGGLLGYLIDLFLDVNYPIHVD